MVNEQRNRCKIRHKQREWLKSEVEKEGSRISNGHTIDIQCNIIGQTRLYFFFIIIFFLLFFFLFVCKLVVSTKASITLPKEEKLCLRWICLSITPCCVMLCHAVLCYEPNRLMGYTELQISTF